MRNILSILILSTLTTACGQAPTSSASALTGDPTDQASAAANAQADSAPPANQPWIDNAPRAALNYAGANAFCQNLSRKVCTKSQYLTGYSQGKLAYTSGAPGYYWMETVVEGYAKNNFLAATSGTDQQFHNESLTRKFYCCKNE